LSLIYESAHEIAHVILQSPSTCDDDTNRNRSVSMQSFEILQVAVEEWVFVIPLDLQRDKACIEFADVIYLMRGSFSLFTIDSLPNDKFCLRPIAARQVLAKPLSALCLAPSTSK
jgi:hypothetical protein